MNTAEKQSAEIIPFQGGVARQRNEITETVRQVEAAEFMNEVHLMERNEVLLDMLHQKSVAMNQMREDLKRYKARCMAFLLEPVGMTYCAGSAMQARTYLIEWWPIISRFHRLQIAVSICGQSRELIHEDELPESALFLIANKLQAACEWAVNQLEQLGEECQQ
ncbi:hypothetical protein [Kistimonas asteriae]|uniref:hypothetical protein n=1 Tax=Kistimonas asteriae TaxID=517724 RepID=UPI001BA90965|nr:hypothetical protein [Kistimonas asteriae]